MAESILFNLASNILSTISAFERDRSMGDARDELRELTRSIAAIQAVLLDAESKLESSPAVKGWLNRLRNVLYDVDDLFDGVVTNQMHNMKGSHKSLKKVSVYIQKFNPIVSSDFVKKVNATRKRLIVLSSDMNAFEFIRSQPEDPIRGFEKRRHTGSYVNSESVIGREEDKKAILEMLLNETDNDVIAIVGIGAIGKTTLAQLIYNDKYVVENFEKMWFACLSHTYDDREIIGRIYESIGKGSYSDFTVSQLQTKIRESVESKKFMLVLDDVWDDNHARWQHRMNLFSNGSKGSKIIVTTRSFSVAKAVGALRTHNLGGLSEEESWDLFKRVVFSSGQENDPRLIDIGRVIVKKCTNVPLCIKIIGNILYTKGTIQEWESIKNQELSKLEESRGNPIMNVLKLSYDQLPSNLKQCFAYCSLFPKDFRYDVKKLVYLWIGQGYIKKKNNDKEQTAEQVGHSYFMDLFQRCFFQEAEEWHGVIYSCKMHPLIHDLAAYVAGEEVSTLSTQPYHFRNRARHVAAIGDAKDSSWKYLAQSLDINRVRSVVIDTDDSGFPMTLYQLTQFKTLRTLILRALGIGNVPIYIDELKQLRYLDLSGNKFVNLPNSMTNLWNLIVLDLKGCTRLEVLPQNFRNLMNLRDLSIWGCSQLKDMPPGIGEMTSLQYLDAFKVGKNIKWAKRKGIETLAGLHLRGILGVEFEDDIVDWDGDERFQLPLTLEGVSIDKYPGMSIPHWANRTFSPPNLVMIYLLRCKKLRDLPPFRCLPNLKSLLLDGLEELEYVDNGNDEHEEGHNRSPTRAQGSADTASRFFPRLEILKLANMPKLMGWKKEVHIEADSEEEKPPRQFPSLSQLMILNCPRLKSIPQCPHLQLLQLIDVAVEEIQQFLSTPPRLHIASSLDEALPSLRRFEILNCHNLRILHLTYPRLQTILITQCDGLQSLHINQCNQLKSLHIARLNALKELTICSACPELELWKEDEEKRCHLDWDSLPNLSQLTVDRPPPTEKLPNCLQHLQLRGNLHIKSPMTDPSRASTSREEEP